MKNRFIYIMSFAFLITSCNEQSFQLDDILQQCYDSKYQQEGYDIKAIIDNYEKLLINDGVLIDGNGKSYLEVYNKVISDKGFRIMSEPFQEYDPWHKIDKKIAVTVFECERQMIELAKKEDSRWINLFNKFEAAEIEENPEMMYQEMQENLSKKDLKSYYFKLKMFNIFDMVNAKWENL
ncbi:hypothetical protein [Allomuricauda sp.]|uniref:hypothetical protein n=1 Tax=Flagellimonas sp. TaxID=2058762 RepID=UPI001B057403|nr:hypothetical protein [Allomuricauda sp.]MBO6829905.1 hypothetical protein [Allomuricauda sp.]